MSLWWKDNRNIAELGRWLEANGRLPRDQWEVVALADRYTPEWEEFQREEAMDRLFESDTFEADIQRRSSAA